MKRAVILIALAGCCIAGGGWLYALTEHVSYGRGLYCAVGTASTDGCDLTAGTTAARIASVVVILTAIPLLAAAFGTITSAHLRRHMGLHMQSTVAQVKHELASVQKDVTARVDSATAELHRRFDDHAALVASAVAQRPESVVAADGPAEGGPAAARRAAADGLPDVPVAATTKSRRASAKAAGM